MDALAKQLGIASTTVANWIRQARIDDGERPGITTADRDELTKLRSEIRRLEMENEILKPAAAYFAKEKVLPQLRSGWSVTWPRKGFLPRWSAGCCTCPSPAITQPNRGRPFGEKQPTRR